MKRKPLTDKGGEVRTLTAADFKRMRPASEVLPPDLYAALTAKKRGTRGKQKTPVKKPITVRLDADVVEYFKSTGAGWQTRINALLKAAVESIKP